MPVLHDAWLGAADEDGLEEEGVLGLPLLLAIHPQVTRPQQPPVVPAPTTRALSCIFSSLGVKKSRPSQNVPRKAQKVIVPPKKNYVPNFLKQRDIGNFMSFCNHGPSILYFKFNQGNNTKNADF